MERFLRFSTKKKKFISSVLAGVFYLFGGASLVTLGNLNVFLISHIYHGAERNPVGWEHDNTNSNFLL